MKRGASAFFFLLGAFMAFTLWLKPEPDEAIPMHRVTFHVIPRAIPDSAKVYVTGDNSTLGNLNPAFAPLEKQNDGSWRKTFELPAALKVSCTFDLGNTLTVAVGPDRAPLDKLAFTVRQDTTIVVAVTNWRDATLAAEEKLSPAYRAEVLFEEARASHARLSLEERLKLFTQAGGLYAEAELWEKQMEALIRAGNLWYRKGDYDEAQKVFERVVQIALRRFGETHARTAMAYEALAHFYTGLGDYERALALIQTIMRIEPGGDGKISFELPGRYNMLAFSSQKHNRWEEALTYRKKALAAVLAFFGPTHQEVGNSYRRLGLLHAERGDYDEALACFKQAWKILVCYRHESTLAAHVFHEDLGTIYLRKGDLAAAEKSFHRSRAMRLQRYGPKSVHMANVYFNLAETHYKRGSLDSTLAYTQKALIALLPDFNDENIAANPPLQMSNRDDRFLACVALKAEALERRAKLAHEVAQRRGDLETAFAASKLAAALIEQMRRRNLTEEAKFFVGNNSKRIYARGIQAALQLREITGEDFYKEEAFQFAEQSRAGVLLQDLQEAEAKRVAAIPMKLLERERGLKAQLAALETEMEKFRQQPESADAQANARQKRYHLLQAEFKALIAELEQEYPNYYQLKYQNRTLTVAEAQRALEEHTALLQYFVEEDALTLFLVARDRFEVVQLPLDQEFSKRVEACFSAAKRVLDEPRFLRESAYLYRTLLAPMAERLAGKRKLVIIPDEALFFLPFEALLARPLSTPKVSWSQADFLIKHFEIVYGYSATQFYYTQQNAVRPTLAAQDLVAFAPVFSAREQNGVVANSNRPALAWFGNESKENWVTRDGALLRELKFSAVEAQAITALFAGRARPSANFLHRTATEENFKRHAEQSKLLHISTHGFVNLEKPRFSGLAFSQPQDSTSGEDGIFYAMEAYSLKLNADLVVLSSCESGVGKLVQGEGVMALTRGFMYAGARNMVVSLWKVFDEHTSRLMIEFYKGIAEGQSYSAALRAAKLRMLENEHTARPASWASFVLIGS